MSSCLYSEEATTFDKIENLPFILTLGFSENLNFRIKNIICLQAVINYWIIQFLPFRLPVSNGYQIVKLCSSSWLLTSLIILSLKASAVISSISRLNFCKFRILFNMQSFGNGLLLMSHWVDVFLLGKKFKSSGLTWVCPREKVLRII